MHVTPLLKMRWIFKPSLHVSHLSAFANHSHTSYFLQHKRPGFPRPFSDFGTRLRSRTPCRLAFLALGLCVRICRGCPHLSFLFSARGGHATVASLTLCLAACPQCTQTETWWPRMCVSSFPSVPSPCLIFADPPALVMLHIGHVQHGAYRKSYQLRA